MAIIRSQTRQQIWIIHHDPQARQRLHITLCREYARRDYGDEQQREIT